MTVKVTLLFSQTSGISAPAGPHRTGGWSETWYYAGTSIPNAIIATIGPPVVGPGAPLPLCFARAGLLGLAQSIVGQRFQLVDPPAGSQSTGANFPGALPVAQDIPQMALLCKVPAIALPNIRRVVLRGLPDAYVVEGEFAPTVILTNALATFANALSVWRFRGRDLTQTTYKILTIDALGVFTTELAHTIPTNAMVRVLRTLDATGDLVGGRFKITAPTGSGGTLIGWTAGATKGGSIRVDGVVYPQVDSSNFIVNRVITRRVGRPFGQYRGRRSRRS